MAEAVDGKPYRTRKRSVTGVLALPFHVMITYTGIVTLSLVYMPWGVTTAHKGDSQTFFAESGQITVAADVATVEAHPLRRWGAGEPMFLWFDGAMLALAALFAIAARKVAHHRALSRAERSRERSLPTPAPRSPKRQAIPMTEHRHPTSAEGEHA